MLWTTENENKRHTKGEIHGKAHEREVVVLVIFATWEDIFIYDVEFMDMAILRGESSEILKVCNEIKTKTSFRQEYDFGLTP